MTRKMIAGCVRPCVGMVVAALLASVLVTVAGGAANAQGQDFPIGFTDGAGAAPHAAPAAGTAIGAPVADGTSVSGMCWTTGGPVTNSIGYSSAYWVKDQAGMFWSEATLDTGVNGPPPGLNSCEGPPSYDFDDWEYADYCFAGSCTDRDPATTLCVDDAETIWEVNAIDPSNPTNSRGEGLLEMRYSPTCHSNWVRFTPWAGLRDALGTFVGGEVFGSAWIWRAGADEAPRGVTQETQSSDFAAEKSVWTTMISAEGETCMSVDLHATVRGESGTLGYDIDELGTFEAGCIS